MRTGATQRAGIILLLGLFGAGVAATPSASAPAASAIGVEIDTLPRHPLERLALQSPEAALEAIPSELEKADTANDPRSTALLYLAKANACRVLADWDCQIEAGALAAEAGEAAQDPIVQARGLVAEALGRSRTRDFSLSEGLLAKAEWVLRATDSPEMSADIYLNYSSLSHYIGKFGASVEYAEKGLAALSGDTGLAMQVRLLRNLARSRTELGQIAEARQALERAESKLARIDDPKLLADVLLEGSRLARATGDFAAHEAKARQVLALGETGNNVYTESLAREALGHGELQRGRVREASREFDLAYAGFATLGLDREERRVLRQIVPMKLQLSAPRSELAPRVERLLSLESTLDAQERNNAAAEYELRLERMKQSAEIQELETESARARERQLALERTNRLTLALVLASGLAITVLAFFFVQNQRSKRALGRAYDRLRASRSQMQEVMRLSAAYVFLCDTTGRIVQANPSMALALGRLPEELEGMPLAAFLGTEGEAVQADFLGRVLASRSDECVLSLHDGKGRERQWRVISRVTAKGEFGENIVGTAVDITEQLEQTEALREQSLRDPLTGCFNRRFLAQFEKAGGDRCWALIAFDLDGFKHINDSFGHEHGDRVLQGMARFLADRVRSADSLLRLGGDEFLILLPQADESVLNRLVQRLDTDRMNAPCGFSMGAELRMGTEPLASTLARADAAMYEAKKRRRQH
jgi:diguanylate cyclase (GGDEF)-like protein/PAS domain S-box-containing protein